MRNTILEVKLKPILQYSLTIKHTSMARQTSKQISKAAITKLSHDGRGIAHINGKITFIEGALPDEEVMFMYTQRRSKYDEGRVTEVLTASSMRAEPGCQHYHVCGGCNLQHLQPSDQLALKQAMLLEQLTHFGELSPEEVLPPLTGPLWEYRRKARLGVKYVAKKAAVLVGFREKDSRFLADLTVCEVLHPSVGKKLLLLKQLIAGLEAYQQIPQIEVAIGDNATVLIVRHMVALSTADLGKLTEFAQQQQLQIFLQPGGMETVHPLWPTQPDTLYYELPDFDLKLEFKPTDFTQVNAEINQRMVSYALDLLEVTPTDRVLDLFCGLGNFTLPLARRCKAVVGVEGDAGMVTRGYENARLNAIQNVDFYAADLSRDFSTASWAQQGFDKILLDPPRTGALEVIQHLSAFKARRIVYVSCNPATLARDAGVLAKQGYRLTKAGIMDMFPHTRHVESIAVFEYKNK